MATSRKSNSPKKSKSPSVKTLKSIVSDSIRASSITSDVIPIELLFSVIETKLVNQIKSKSQHIIILEVKQLLRYANKLNKGNYKKEFDKLDFMSTVPAKLTPGQFLFYAARGNNPDIARLLLENRKISNNDIKSAFEESIKKRSGKVAQLLIQSGKLSQVDRIVYSAELKQTEEGLRFYNSFIRV